MKHSKIRLTSDCKPCGGLNDPATCDICCGHTYASEGVFDVIVLSPPKQEGLVDIYGNMPVQLALNFELPVFEQPPLVFISNISPVLIGNDVSGIQDGVINVGSPITNTVTHNVPAANVAQSYKYCAKKHHRYAAHLDSCPHCKANRTRAKNHR